jgi:hypothetical protein
VNADSPVCLKENALKNEKCVNACEAMRPS